MYKINRRGEEAEGGGNIELKFLEFRLVMLDNLINNDCKLIQKSQNTHSSFQKN